MKKVAVSYKGKHFIITDEDLVDEMDGVDPYVDVERVIDKALISHVEDCLYYGIPAYYGKDEQLKERIRKIEDELSHVDG